MGVGDFWGVSEVRLEYLSLKSFTIYREVMRQNVTFVSSIRVHLVMSPPSSKKR